MRGVRDGAAHAFAAQWAGDGLWASAMHGLAQAGEPLHLDLLSMRGDGALFV